MSDLTTKQIIDNAEGNLLHTYGRYQIVFEKGKGCELWDRDGKRYLDFTAGIAVFALGHCNENINNAMKSQIDKLIHTSNYYYTEPLMEAAEKFTKASGMDKVFFTNSGAEAVEGALKLARKYYFNKNGKADSEIIAMDHSFHGRTMGAVSVTGTKKYRDPFEPLIGGTVFATYNDLDSVKALVNDKTAAIILETVQGEGGIYPANEEFIKGIRKICDEKDIVMILDEIQCGMGRTGKMFAYENYGILPDVMTSAKALGCGVPIGAFAARGKFAEALVPGDHGSTYGGNPFATATASAVFDEFERLNVVDNVNAISAYMWEKLDNLMKKHENIVDHRGMGLMQGLEFNEPVKDIIAKAMDKGLLLISAGANTVRFLPALIVEKKHVDEMVEILEGVLK